MPSQALHDRAPRALPTSPRHRNHTCFGPGEAREDPEPDSASISPVHTHSTAQKRAATGSREQERSKYGQGGLAAIDSGGAVGGSACFANGSSAAVQRPVGRTDVPQGYLTRSETPAQLSFLDGKPLSVSFCSHDPDARVGYATTGFARGYKLHALASSDGRILRHALRPMNEGEAKVARDFAGDDVGGWVLADANYDTKNLYQAFGAHDVQFLTPLKRIAVHSGPLRRMGPHRRFDVSRSGSTSNPPPDIRRCWIDATRSSGSFRP